MSEPAEVHREPGLRLRVLATAEEAACAAAALLAECVAAGSAARPAVLGLATGRSVVPVYAELVRRQRAGLSFRHAVTFNLDEYHPIAAGHPGSFHRFMRERLFDLVDLERGACHLPDGSLPAEQLAAHGAEYERRIRAAGGIDVQLLGLGGNGHIGFNEPGSAAESRTRLVTLAAATRADNAAAFAGGAMPRQAVTMGIATILAARRIVLLAFGARKAPVLRRLLAEPPHEGLPATFLKRHPDVLVLADRAAAAELPAGTAG